MQKGVDLIMDVMPLVSLVCYSIPEAYLIFAFGLVIIGEKVNFLRILPPALAFAIITYFVRQLQVPFGVHVMIHNVFILGLFILAFRLRFKHALLATLLSTGTLLAFENTFLYSIQHIFNLRLEEIWQNVVLRTLIGWPHLLVWTVITVLLYKYEINLTKFKGNH